MTPTPIPSAVSVVGEKLDAETLERRLHLWFFRDLSDAQRLGLFNLSGYPVDELQTHAIQQLSLRNLINALSRRSLETAVGVERPSYDAISAMVHACRERQKTAGEGDQMLSRWISEGLDGLFASRTPNTEVVVKAICAWPNCTCPPESRCHDADFSFTLQPMDTAPTGDDALEPSEIEVHEGSWAVLMGTNAKPIGWIDTHALFHGRTYRDRLASHPSPARVTVSRDDLAEIISEAGAPPGPPDGPIGALPDGHFLKVQAYKQADAVIAHLASPAREGDGPDGLLRILLKIGGLK